MQALTATQIVETWSRGESASVHERALVMLRAGRPELSPDDLAALSIGQRDLCLLELREATFGPTLAGAAPCPGCNATLKFDLDTREIRAEAATALPPHEHVVEMPGLTVQVRRPDSRDLAAAQACASVEEAVEMLLHACVVGAWADAGPVAIEALPDDAIAVISARLEALDPLAEIPVELACSICSREWSVLLDIAAFLWAEVAAMADRLMYDVSRLAPVYGWSEAEILALGPARRRYYLEMASPQ